MAISSLEHLAVVVPESVGHVFHGVFVVAPAAGVPVVGSVVSFVACGVGLPHQAAWQSVFLLEHADAVASVSKATPKVSLVVTTKHSRHGDMHHGYFPHGVLHFPVTHDERVMAMFLAF